MHVSVSVSVFIFASLLIGDQLIYRQLTSEQYNSVCQKLVTNFPKLRDTIGSNGYVSFISYFVYSLILIVIMWCCCYIGFMEARAEDIVQEF